MNCAACCSIIDEKEEYSRCTMPECSKAYHCLCTGEKKTALVGTTWVCPECRCAAKKGGDNSLTPVGFSKKHRNPNVTLRQKIPRAHLENKTDFAASELSQDLTEFHQLRDEIVLMREHLINSNALIANYETQLNQSITLIANYERKLDQSVSTITKYETKIEKFTSHIDKLLNKLKCCTCNSNNSNADGTNNQLLSQAQSVSQQSSPLSSVAIPRRTPPPSVPQLQIKMPVVVCANASRNAKATSVHVQKQVNREFGDHVSSVQKPRLPLVNQTSSDQAISESSIIEKPDNENWTEVKKKTSRRLTSLCGTAGPTVTSLKAVAVRKYLHLWNMASDIDEVRDYLCQLCSNGHCTVEELTAKGDYKSYKIGVPAADYDTCFSINVWPINARIKAWINYKRPPKQPYSNSNDGTASSPQPFRRRPSTRATPTH